MGLLVLDGNSPHDGSEPIPVGQGRYGIDDQMRNLEVMTPGMAVSSMNSTSQADRKSIYKFGSASARPEFFGVVYTKGASPSMSLPICTDDASTVSVIYEGYAPLLLAPGQTVRRGQWLEPIPSGTSQAYFRVATTGRGVAQARNYCDNSSGTEPIWVGADLVKSPGLSGILGAVGPGSNLTGTTSETAYGAAAAATVTIPAYSLRAGDRFRIVGTVLSNNIAAGNNTVKGYINGIGSGVLFTAPAVTFAANDVVDFQIDCYVASIGGSGSVSLSGSVAAGTPGTATHRAIPGSLTMDTTVANVVTIANTPNNNADSSKLLFLSVERLS